MSGASDMAAQAPGILGRQRSSLASATFITSLRSVAITIRMMSELMTPVVLKTPAACEIRKRVQRRARPAIPIEQGAERAGPDILAADSAAASRAAAHR